jgi:Domain of Unknown Function (DUF326)
MSYARQMLGTYPAGFKLEADADALAAVIDASVDCAQACTTDTDADLSEPHLAEMVTCIRLCQDCADICAVTGAVLSRPATWDSHVLRPLIEACAAICKRCGSECERHAPIHAHCRVCAAACRRCEQACSDFLKIIK